MKPYDSEETKKSQVRRMFNAIAGSYDMLNHLLSAGVDRRWRRRAVRLASSASPRDILDLATGTGDMAIALARANAEARITGVDLSEGMVAEGRRKVEAAGLAGRVELRTGDAEALDLPAESFDAVTVAFGVRNFGDIAAGLSEMKRVLRRGGIVCILEFSTPRGKIFGPLYRFYFHRVLPVVGGWISRDRKAYEYLPSSVDEFPGPEEFVAMMSHAGFSQNGYVTLMFGVARIYTGKA